MKFNFAKVLSFKELAVLILIYALLILCFGFNWSGNDMIEVIPVLKNFHDGSLYPNDFFINYIKSQNLYERSFYIKFLQATCGTSRSGLFAIHLLFTLSLIIALYKIGTYFISEKFANYVLIILLLFFASRTSLGGNELYYNMPVSSFFAKALGSWAIYLIFVRRYYLCSSFLIVSTLFHPIVGIQIFVILIGGLLLHFRSVLPNFKKVLVPALLYLAITLPYLSMLFLKTLSIHGHYNILFDILEFRVGHHFFIEYASISSILFYLLFITLGFYYYKIKNKFIYYSFIFQFLMLVLYIVMVSVFKSELFLKLQWLKTTIWIELFGIIALVEISFSKLKYSNLTEQAKKNVRYVCFSVLLLGISLLIIKNNYYNVERQAHLEERALASFAKNHTGKEATFITPADFYLFKSNAERSSWIDFKAIAHHPAYLIPWYDRISTLYQINLNDRKMKHNLISEANRHYKQIDADKINYLKSQGVNYMIQYKDVAIPSLNVSKVFETNRFVVYELD
ncbi:MAG: hypothetical protein M3Q56_11635 [Bacteroidota bacterium]|nr:hypothetical protein [Bacteroidota bacterium]